MKSTSFPYLSRQKLKGFSIDPINVSSNIEKYSRKELDGIPVSLDNDSIFTNSPFTRDAVSRNLEKFSIFLTNPSAWISS